MFDFSVHINNQWDAAAGPTNSHVSSSVDANALCLSLPSLVHIPVLLGSHTKRSWEGMCAP